MMELRDSDHDRPLSSGWVCKGCQPILLAEWQKTLANLNVNPVPPAECKLGPDMFGHPEATSGPEPSEELKTI